MKRLIAIISLLSLLLGMAACGSGKDANPTTKPSDTKPDVNHTATALVINDYEISGVELNYFYKDAINQWLNSYGNYAAYFGLDLSAPLDTQVYDQETGDTWADYFIDMAVSSAKNTYALYDAAQKAGYELSETDKEQIEEIYDNMEKYVTDQGYETVDAYLKETYGDSADMKSYREFCDITFIASFYYSNYTDNLSNGYTTDDLLAFVGDKGYQYNSYSYASIYLPLNNFIIGGTKGEDGKLTYSDEELKAAEDYLAKVAGDLTSGDIDTVVKLNVAIGLMEDELAAAKGESAPSTHTTVTENSNMIYSKISELMQPWLRDAARVPGDITAIPYEVSTKADDGSEVKTLKGYYIILFQSVNENNFALANVRHILAAFEGGTKDKTTGQTIYSEAEKEQAKTKAQQLLEQWTKGDATEDSFAQLANKHSADGDGTTGGLYEDIYPGQMVTNFNDWCFDERRQPGDTGIVESVYGYHVMYYVGDSDLTYRLFMIKGDKLQADINEWQTALNDSMKAELKDTAAVDTSYVIVKSK